LPRRLQRLIDEFRRLPGIGQKSAQRLAFYVLRSPRDQAAALAAALTDVKDNLGICAECNNISDAELCPYCRDPNRDRTCDLYCGRTARHSSGGDHALFQRLVSRAGTARFLRCAASDRSN
jgi:hypothetical protein